MGTERDGTVWSAGYVATRAAVARRIQPRLPDGRRLGIRSGPAGVGRIPARLSPVSLRSTLSAMPPLRPAAVPDSVPTGATFYNHFAFPTRYQDTLFLADWSRGRILTVAVMGCVVNGPGEAKMADLGIAGGKGRGVIFRQGEIVKTVDEPDFMSALIEEGEKIIAEIDAGTYKAVGHADNVIPLMEIPGR